MVAKDPIPIDFEEKRGLSHPWSSTERSRPERVLNQAESSVDQHNVFNMDSLQSEMKAKNLQPDTNMDEDIRASEKLPEDSCSDSAAFLDPNEISISSICVALVPCSWGIQRLRILHKDSVLQLCCSGLKLRFGISTKFSDHAGRPKLNFMVDATPGLCRVLDACDDAALKVSVDSGSESEWRPVVMRKNGYFNAPNVRLQ